MPPDHAHLQLQSNTPIARKKQSPIQKLVHVAARVVVVLTLGCSGPQSDGPALHPVKGIVRFQGAPAPLVLVVFHPADPKAAKSYAKTGPTGEFELSTHEAKDGVMEGSYTITLTWPPSEEEETRNYKDKLLGRYADPAQSKLTFDVKPGANLVPPIDLSSK